ncbi:sensor domain-containing diguanylate cyclase [Acinetobacter johnsonii]|uniref:GGDEF domain-containing protein n=1 Tax=Acinetobacter TaxID=469 RepID=UPI00133074D2|nr:MULTISPECIES: sensor domain-containing diguanylate cyclase [Acinetobacter]MDH1726517.1 sensor domain-containing diguanylate cyclase [Acinetobacter johnsonii]NWK59972.1 sensor domain-containing diguanylate cyclase [Acinetobacter sp. SwsAc2]NWK63355.1 sensor domain-containing diguanylate cyclase [Acinetobacter sp. SwsAc3]UBQ37180.1 sensor domain-containing diguanylate cyclase [Acinetobacter johnsonii]
MSDSIFNSPRIVNDLVYKTLIESTLAIPWSIDWETKTFSYIGPQIEKVLGWKQDSWRTVEDWAMRMHENDRAWVVDFCVAQSISGVDHEADYRALTINGEYIWIRDVVHVVRKPDGEVDSLVGFMFDISERKKQEQELETLKKQLEEYSYQDGLTGIANRRFFEDSYQREWLNAQREQQPLTLMLLDIDYFKQYNDYNGHILGDACLKQIAQLLKKSVSRPRDLVARFGGEEFVLILPDTTQASAIEVVERILQSIRTADICHSSSPLDQRLSVSLGVKTIIPTQKNDKMAFLKEVDQNLYLAKEQGRNGYVIQDAEDVQHLNSY